MRIGLISDTHGMLRPEAITFLSGCDHIIHSGDIGHIDIITKLSILAPVTAVRGNMDRRGYSAEFPKVELVKIGGIIVYVLHDLSLLEINPSSVGIKIVVSGHTHKPFIEEREGIFYINPGSAGPKRPNLPVSLAEINIISDQVILSRIIELEVED